MRTYGAPRLNTQRAIDFINGNATDHVGRTVSTYVEFDADKWEECHDHIQWAFPSNIPSNFNPYAPVVDLEEFKAGLNESGWEHIRIFTIIYMDSLGIDVQRGNAYNDNELIRSWSITGNHNHRRITRLLNLWHVLDSEVAHRILYEFISNSIYAAAPKSDIVVGHDPAETVWLTIHKLIGEVTVAFWMDAADGILLTP